MSAFFPPDYRLPPVGVIDQTAAELFSGLDGFVRPIDEEDLWWIPEFKAALIVNDEPIFNLCYKIAEKSKYDFSIPVPFVLWFALLGLRGISGARITLPAKLKIVQALHGWLDFRGSWLPAMNTLLGETEYLKDACRDIVRCGGAVLEDVLQALCLQEPTIVKTDTAYIIHFAHENMLKIPMLPKQG